MKKNILFSIVSFPLLVSTALYGQTKLIHYEFNNSDTATTVATDSSGNGRDGNITNWSGTAQVAAALQTATGVSGLAGDYAFDNSGAPGMGGFSNRGGVVRWDGTPEVDMISSLRALTMSYWFKTPESVVAGGAARAASLSGQSDVHFFENRFETDGFGRTVVTGSSTSDSATAAYNQSNTWTFAAFTFDGTAAEAERIKMYVGDTSTAVSLVGTFSSSLTAINIGTADNKLILGGYISGSGQTPFQAIMDDFRLYGNGGATNESALSLSQLEAVRSSAIPEPQTSALLIGLVCFLGVAGRTRYLKK